MDLIHGIVLPADQSVGYAPWYSVPYTSVDYERFKRWGLNAVIYSLGWTSPDVEPTELGVGIYNETFLAALREQVDLAKKNGLKVFIENGMVFFHGGGGEGTWSGWSDIPRLGAEYVNRNLPDASGSLGRDRYCKFLSMLAARFADCGIDAWAFPYHGQGELINAESRTIFYNVTQPAFIKAIRDAGNKQPIILNPMAQGALILGTADHYRVLQTGEFTVPEFKVQADPNVYYGTNTHDGSYVFATEQYNLLIIDGVPWDYDLDTLKKQTQPAVDFSKTHPVITVEMSAMNVLSQPMDASRVAWLKETLEIYKQNNMSWFYYRYENPSTPLGQSPQNPDGSDTEVAQLLKEYAPTPTPPIALPFHDDFIDLSKWQILKGTFITKNMLDGISVDEGLIVAGDTAWADYILTAKCRIISDSVNNEIALVARYQDSSNFYWLGLGCWRHRVSISRVVNGLYEELVSAGDISEVTTGKDYILQVSVIGNHLRLFVDGTLALEIDDPSLPSGAIGIRPWSSHVEVDYVDVTAPPVIYNLTITSTTGGTTDPTSAIYECDAGTIVTVTAKPNEGSTFKRFELDGEVKMQNPINVGMDADHSLLAVFEVAAPPISPSIVFLFLLTLLGSIGAVAVTKKGGE